MGRRRVSVRLQKGLSAADDALIGNASAASLAKEAITIGFLLDSIGLESASARSYSMQTLNPDPQNSESIVINFSKSSGKSAVSEAFFAHLDGLFGTPYAFMSTRRWMLMGWDAISSMDAGHVGSDLAVKGSAEAPSGRLSPGSQSSPPLASLQNGDPERGVRSSSEHAVVRNKNATSSRAKGMVPIG